MLSYEKLRASLKNSVLFFSSISWTVVIRIEMSTCLLCFSPCCAGNVPLSLFLSKMKQAKKEAIHRSISSIIQIHLSTVRSNIVVYILHIISKVIIRLFCFKTECALFGVLFWNVPILECALFGMRWKQNVPFWNVLFLLCDQNKMSPFFNAFFFECALFWIMPFFNAIKTECALFEMFFLERVLFGVCCLWNVIKTECPLLWNVIFLGCVLFGMRSE